MYRNTLYILIGLSLETLLLHPVYNLMANTIFYHLKGIRIIRRPWNN